MDNGYFLYPHVIGTGIIVYVSVDTRICYTLF